MNISWDVLNSLDSKWFCRYQTASKKNDFEAFCYKKILLNAAFCPATLEWCKGKELVDTKPSSSVHKLMEQAAHRVAIMYLVTAPSAIKTLGDSSLWVNEGKYFFDRCFQGITGVFNSVRYICVGLSNRNKYNHIMQHYHIWYDQSNFI